MLRLNKLRGPLLSSWLGQVGLFRMPCIVTASQPTFGNIIDESSFCYRLRCREYIVIQTRLFSSTTETILVLARDPAKLSMGIENAIHERRYLDSWRLFEQHMQLEGFPRKSLVNKLIASFAETLDSQLLNQALGLVEQAFEEGKQELFEKETLLYLSLALARCNRPVPASFLLRKLIAMEEYPPVTAWSTILAYMALSPSGAYLAAEIVLEIGYFFKNNRIDPRKKINAPLIAMKPNALALCVVLAGCLVFGTTRIAEQVLDIMPGIGVKTSTMLLILMAHIYEKNGRREELKELKRYVDEAPDLNETQFRQYYNCLLTCHLKFGDLDSVSHMVLEMLHKAKEAHTSLAAATLMFEPSNKSVSSSSTQVCAKMNLITLDGVNHSKHFSSFTEFIRDRNFICLQGEVEKIIISLSVELQKQTTFVVTERGVLQPTENTFVKLAKAFLEVDKTKELAEFLIKAENKGSPCSADDSALVHVINSCISLGRIDQAHDLLDEMRFAGVRISSSVYASLLKAYIKAHRKSEVMSLLREVQRAGIQLDASCYEALIQYRVLQKDNQGALHLLQR